MPSCVCDVLCQRGSFSNVYPCVIRGVGVGGGSLMDCLVMFIKGVPGPSFSVLLDLVSTLFPFCL